MKIPNFKTQEGAVLYKDTVGKFIAPKVAQVLMRNAQAEIETKAATIRQYETLDLGCGPGTVSLALAEKYPDLHIVGADSSENMILECQTAAANRGYNTVQFVQADASEIDTLESSFHLVVSNLAFPFFPRPAYTMQAVYQIVRPGGTVIFTVPGRHTWEEFFEVAKAVVGPVTKVARPFLTKFTQAEKLPESMNEAGFQDIQVSTAKIPFSFEDGQHVLNFFAELFHLLDFAPQIAQDKLVSEIDKRFPEGFTMHYEAVIVRATKNNSN